MLIVPLVRALPMLLAALLLANTGALAVEASGPSPDWAPPPIDEAVHDRITLNTGEELIGKIKLIEEGTLYFDSDKLDEQSFDWYDITGLRTARPHTFRFAGRRSFIGSAEMRGDVIRIRSGEEVHELRRKDLVYVVPGSGREIDNWALSLSLGLSGQAGNTEQISLNTSLTLMRATALSISRLKYTGNLATQAGDLSANNHRASLMQQWYLSQKIFLIAPTFEVFQDEFQNIELRLTPALGAGYNLIENRIIEWKVGLAAGYQGTKFSSVDQGSDTASDAVLQFNLYFDLDLPKRFEWENSYQVQAVVTDIGKTNQHLSSTLSFDFWGPLDFDTTFQWDYVADPQANSDGNVPESSDFRITVGLALDL